ncbi:GNAT family N-acetyltransferase [Pseudarthrobacter sp. P1]|uniref:GNAT family N-acetyltransferase n=1 Tax=Pseudarthrobacter sp. P1 TaxID=3418418 RepID=UPI003CF0FC74
MRRPPEEIPDMLQHWFIGWAALRAYPTSWASGHPAARRRERASGWEFFIGNPAPLDLAALAAVAADSPDSVLSVWGPDVQRYVDQAHLAGLSLVSTAETLMELDLSGADAEDPYLADPEFTLATARVGGRHDSSDAVARYATTIRTGQTLAAWGTVAVVGDAAVFDQLQTSPDFRRRGFGRMVVDALTARALDHSVQRGLLLASPAGQTMYTRLGWHVVCPVTILAAPSAAPVAE